MTREEANEIILVVIPIGNKDYYISRDYVYNVNNKNATALGDKASFEELVLFLSKNNTGEVDERKWLINKHHEMEMKVMFCDDWRILQDCKNVLIQELYYKFRKIFFTK